MPKILLIDDDPVILQFLEGFLENLGYKVFSALDGKVGMEMIWKEHPDLVVTDIVIPEKNGWEVIRETKKEYPKVKIIAMTGGGDLTDFGMLETAKELGADYALSKPFELAKFMQIVEMIFSGDVQDAGCSE